MTLHIKNMVCCRCKMMVRDELKKLGLHFASIDLGEVEIIGNVTTEQQKQLKINLFNIGLELTENKKTILIEKIKDVIIEMVHHTDELIKVNFSDYLSEKINYDYTYMANLFSKVEGTSIEQFIILNKIERIKELMICGELNISEIAWKMNYSSVAHLSKQFKKKTGMPPSYFKQLKEKRRVPIDKIADSNYYSAQNSRKLQLSYA